MDADDICYPERLDVQIEISAVQSGSRSGGIEGAGLSRRGQILGVMSPPITGDEIMSRLYEGIVFPHPTWCGRAAWFRKHRYDERMLITQDQELLLRTADPAASQGSTKFFSATEKKQISLSKSARGRMLFCRAMWRHAQKTGTRVRAIAYVAKQMAKFAAE